jgi:drug/metabolite transporter (DMT)-like permease
MCGNNLLIQVETGRVLVMRWTLWTAFAALCILSGTSWVIPAAMTDGLPMLEQQGLLFGMIGLIALAFAVRGRRNGGLRFAWLAAAGVGFFGVPMVVGEYARGSVPAISRSALFAAVPVVVVMTVAVGDTRGREESGARRFLIPALVGLGGLLLLLPLEFSGSLRGWVMLAFVCVAVVLVGLASVRLYRLLRGIALADAVAVVGLANAVFLLGWSVLRDDVVWRRSGLSSMASISSLVDVVEVLLIVWLLREMPPVRFAARYLVIPLLTVLESYVLMRPEWTVRMLGGTALLAAGAAMLLFLKSNEEETMLSLR